MTLSSQNKSRLRECALATLALLVIAGALATTFSHVLQAGPDEISGRYDIYRYYGPITFYLDYCVSKGELPLWNPLVYCGLPNAANPQAFVFYPLNLIRSLLLTEISPQATNESLIALIGLHLLIMGFFTYILGRVHKLSFPGALVASLAWVCSALIVRRACEYHFLYTMAWLPLILILVKCAIDARQGRIKLALSLLAGLFFGLAILGGFLQIVNYLGVTIGVYALVYRLTQASREERPGWKSALARMGFEGFSFAMLLAIAGLAAMALLLPTSELAPYSTRDKGSQVAMYSDMMSWNITRLYQSIVMYAGPKWETETLRATGVTALLLAAAGCFNRRRKLVVLFGLLAYALVDCGFGPPFPIASLVDFLTPFSSSAYSRGFDFALLPLGLLAGLGVDTLLDVGRRSSKRNVLALVLVYIAGATLLPMWVWTHPHGYLPVTSLVVSVPAVALLTMLLALWIRRWRPLVYLIACTLPLIMVGETFAWNSVFVPWMIKRHLREAPRLQTGHAFPTSNQRWTDPIPNRTLYDMVPVMNGVDPLHLADMRKLVSGQFREKLNKREVREWEPTAENTRGNLLLKRFFWLVPAYSTAPFPGKQDLFPPTEVVYLDAPPPGNVPEYQHDNGTYRGISDTAVRSNIPGVDSLLNARSTNQTHRLHLTIPDATDGAPAGPAGGNHATLVYHYTASNSAQIDTIFVDRETKRRQWGLRYRVEPNSNRENVLEVPVPDMKEVMAELTIKGGGVKITDAYLMTETADRDSAMNLRSFTANRVELSVSVQEEPALLLFVDAWYPGWKAWVDGNAVPILRADSAFKAIVVPPGTHEIAFAYQPATVYVGVAISLATVLATAIAILVLLIGQHRRTKQEMIVVAEEREPTPELTYDPVVPTAAPDTDAHATGADEIPSGEHPDETVAPNTSDPSEDSPLSDSSESP